MGAIVQGSRGHFPAFVNPLPPARACDSPRPKARALFRCALESAARPPPPQCALSVIDPPPTAACAILRPLFVLLNLAAASQCRQYALFLPHACAPAIAAQTSRSVVMIEQAAAMGGECRHRAVTRDYGWPMSVNGSKKRIRVTPAPQTRVAGNQVHTSSRCIGLACWHADTVLADNEIGFA